MIKKHLILFFATFMLSAPGVIFALDMPVNNGAMSLQMPATPDSSSFINSNITAHAYIVLNADDGQILAEKNSTLPWVPASLTKLVTALVFLDTDPDLNKIIAIKQSDQTAGGCSADGACIPTKPGISYRLKDLFYASLIASANNATMAVSRSTGLSKADYVNRMNEKAQELGATDTHFVEPAGMDPRNVTTAGDFAKIVQVAFSNNTIQKIDALPVYSFRSTNNNRYAHTIKNTNKLLGDSQLAIVGGKTGYLRESQHNFAAKLMDQAGNNLIVVLMGSRSSASEFRETRQLAELGGLGMAFNNLAGAVLGTSTPATQLINNY